MKKAALIIAFNDFQDQEYFTAKQVLEDGGMETTTFSDSIGMARGVYGGEVKVDKKLYELDVKNFDAVIFIGGGGAFGFIENTVCHQICCDTVKNKKILGAICIAPAILARSGVLKGKRATVWSIPIDKSAIKIFKECGVDYSGGDVEIYGKIITANGPQSAEKFGQAILNSI